MKLSCSSLRIALIGLLFLGLWVPGARAQHRYQRIEEPQWLKLNITEVTLGIYSEGSYDKSTAKNGGSSTTYTRFFIGPQLGTTLNGSIYHPNFCQFNVLSEGAYGRQRETVDSGTKTTTTSYTYLGRYSANANFLNNKPYNLSLFSGYDHTYQDYGFFNRVTLDGWTEGARLAYDQGPWQFITLAERRTEETSDTTQPTSSTVDNVNADLSHTRARGITSLGFALNNYDYGGSGVANTGTDYNVNLADNEYFGAHEQYNLNARSLYGHQTADTIGDNDRVSAGADLTGNLPHNLTVGSSGEYDYYHSGDLNTTTFGGNGRITHQLYESLSSGLMVYGSSTDTSDAGSDGYNNQIGAAWNENYSKNLGGGHRLVVNQVLSGNFGDSKTVATVNNEPHTFSSSPNNPTPDSFYLNQQNVTAVNSVRNAITQQIYTPNLDYEVIVNGSRTLIQRVVGGIIPPDTAVLVDYQVEPTGGGNFDYLQESFMVRFEFWENFWSVFFGVTTAGGHADNQNQTQDFTRLTTGTDLRGRWAQVGAVAEYYDSEDSQYQSVGLYQSRMFRLDSRSSLGVNLTENWINYESSGRQEQNYRFISRYRRSFDSHWSMDADLGGYLRQGDDVDQQIATFRPSIQCIIGQTTFRASYTLDYELDQGDQEQLRQLLFISVNRKF